MSIEQGVILDESNVQKEVPQRLPVLRGRVGGRGEDRGRDAAHVVAARGLDHGRRPAPDAGEKGVPDPSQLRRVFPRNGQLLQI